jgi:hypothetical protein
MQSNPTNWRLYVGATLAAISLFSACHAAIPPVRFAPPGTDVAKLRSDFPLSDQERLALTPEGMRALTQDQVDQIYLRLQSGAIPDGPFRGDLFFPRDRDGNARIRDLAEPAPALPLLASIGAMRAEHFGRVFWKGKAFFKSQGILRNRIEDIALLKPVFDDAETIPKMTFDGQTTWLLFPAKLSCGTSRLDSTRPSTVIDYARGSEVEGFRPVPDKLAGPEGLNIRDEVRIVRPGFYLGRAYFGERFALNFTLLDPAVATGSSPSQGTQEDCNAASAAGRHLPPDAAHRAAARTRDARNGEHGVLAARAAGAGNR